MPLQNLIKKYSQTVGERTEIDKIMTVALLLQRSLGHQVLDPNWTWRGFYHYQVFMIAVFIYVVVGTLSVINNPGVDAELMSEACYTLTIISLCTIKLSLFINNREFLRDLYVMVKTTIIDMIRAESNERVTEVLIKIKKTVYALFVLVIIPFFVYESVAIWNYVNGNRKWLSPTTDTLLPMTTPYYEVSWFLHSVNILEIVSIVTVVDMWFVFFVAFFGHASDSVIKILDIQKRGDRETQRDYGVRLDCALREFYGCHIKLMKYLEKLGKMYKWLALLPLINAALSICIILLVLSERLNLKFAPNILPVFGEVYAYSWFGDQVKAKMYNIEIALLNFDWTSLNRNRVRNYHVMVCYMQKTFSIKTAIGHDLSMITMTCILKSSYQAFTALQSLN